MAQQPQYRHHHDLPPPPPAHQPQGHTQPSQSSYQQPRRPSEQHQQYYQQPPSPQEYQPPSPQDYQLSSHSSQPQYQYQQQPQAGPSSSQRPPVQKKSRSFSFHSDKNKRPASSSHKERETSEEKASHRLTSKADPTLAISEAEPSTVAAMTDQARASNLRKMQHRDSYGNVIADPDKSNPTRSRWERPLDTIRSFEAAIDGAYKRKSMIRSETDPVANWNRRSSYHPGDQARQRPGSYYSSRPQSFQPEQQSTPYRLGVVPDADAQPHRRGHFDEYTGGYLPAPPRHFSPRRDPYRHYNRDPNSYKLNHKDHSYETVTTAQGSAQSEQVGYQTDPTSSDNSSIERRSPSRRPEDSWGGPRANPPSVIRKEVLRKEVPSVSGPGVAPHSQQQQQQQQQPAAVAEKRKSWFARRFSKKN